MLAALEESTRAQQLVGDASHELRTLRLRACARTSRCSPAGGSFPRSGELLQKDILEQLNEMTTLVAELSELARGELETGSRGCPARPPRRRRSRAHARDRPNVQVVADLEESVVRRPGKHRARRGEPPRQRRQVEPARREGRADREGTAKWSSAITGPASTRPTCPTSSTASTGRVRRAGCPARAGLAIVRQVAESHGGQVVAERAEGGGTRVTLRLNGRAVS